MKSVANALLLALCVPIALYAQQSSNDEWPMPDLQVELSVRDDGTATEQWATGIAIAIGEQAANEWISQRIPLSPGAAAWFDVIEAAIPYAEKRGGELARLLDIQPLDATVVVGNRGSSDGFGWIPNFIGINVEAFARTYGMPDDSALDRATRIIAHEHLHLMTYARYPNHLELRTTPMDRALWTIFFEGIGDYVSVSSRWLPDDAGNYSPVTASTLARLEPIFVDRLERLFTADESLENELRAGIAMGKFDEKWGSLPFALWLHSEVKSNDEQHLLRAIFNAERDGVLALAEKHINPDLRPRIAALMRSTGRPSFGVLQNPELQ